MPVEEEEEEEEEAAERSAEKRVRKRENHSQLMAMVSSQCLASRARGRYTFTSSRSTCTFSALFFLDIGNRKAKQLLRDITRDPLENLPRPRNISNDSFVLRNFAIFSLVIIELII